jgi:hypothetical protein
MGCPRALGTHILARAPDRQTAEIHARVAFEPPLHPRSSRDRPQRRNPRGKGSARSQLRLRNSAGHCSCPALLNVADDAACSRCPNQLLIGRRQTEESEFAPQSTKTSSRGASRPTSTRSTSVSQYVVYRGLPDLVDCNMPWPRDLTMGINDRWHEGVGDPTFG